MNNLGWIDDYACDSDQLVDLLRLEVPEWLWVLITDNHDLELLLVSEEVLRLLKSGLFQNGHHFYWFLTHQHGKLLVVTFKVFKLDLQLEVRISVICR